MEAKGEVFRSSSAEETFAHARALAPSFPRALVLLEGALGAGKTTWAKGFAAGLGLRRPVYSPAYTLMNHYAENDRILFHLDFYRINRLEEVHDLGLFEILDAGHPCLIEWPERVPQLTAMPHLHVRLLTCNESEQHTGSVGLRCANPTCGCDESRHRMGEGDDSVSIAQDQGRLITWVWRPQGG